MNIHNMWHNLANLVFWRDDYGALTRPVSGSGQLTPDLIGILMPEVSPESSTNSAATVPQAIDTQSRRQVGAYEPCGSKNHNWHSVFCMRRVGHSGPHERHLRSTAIVWYD